MRLGTRLGSLALAGFFGVACHAVAQPYPSKPVRIVIPYGAGSGLDTLMRQMARELNVQWNQPVLVENRPGANGIVAAETCKKAASDGHTVCLFARDLFYVPYVQKDLSVEPLKDLRPVTNLFLLVSVVAAYHGDRLARMKDLLAAARAKPGTLNYGSLGPGSAMQIFFEWMKKKYDVNLVHVPYKTPVDLVQSTVSGQTNVAMLGVLNFLGQIRGGKVTALAVNVRTPLLPGVPTLAEQGIPWDLTTWFGFFVPAGTATEIVRKIRDDVARMYANQEFRARNLIEQGLYPVANTPEEFARTLPGDIAAAAEFIRFSGAKGD